MLLWHVKAKYGLMGVKHAHVDIYNYLAVSSSFAYLQELHVKLLFTNHKFEILVQICSLGAPGLLQLTVVHHFNNVHSNIYLIVHY